MNLEHTLLALPSATPNAAGGAPAEALRDGALVQQIADGAASALGALYDRFAESVYTLAFGILRSTPDAEEVVEDTFWQAWQSAATFDATRGTVRAWLHTIARSRALDRLRRRRVRADSDARSLDALGEVGPVLADWDAFQPRDPSERVVAEDDGMAIRRALDVLPSLQRELIVLAYFQGLSQTEIASAKQLPLGTVKSRMRRGMERLRDALRPAA